ncbi:M56 family metallopeptidase [Anaerovorax odorimutans]|uniref:M56 family metallopeptidase n=1 Tax=Anaerovorax odorimutans TaxID=109327 RepID=UPI0004154ACD|nr:M56 family metallopeptidase [Anaerovorax odorimutans]
MTESLKIIFLWVIYSSISATMIALLVMAIKSIFKNKIKSRVYCILWSLIILRLIIAPIAPESQISMFNLLSYDTLKLQNQVVQNNNFSIDDSKTYDTSKEKAELEQISIAQSDNGKTDLITREQDTFHIDIDIFFIAALIWLIGLLLITSTIICSSIAFKKRIKYAERIPASQLPQFISCKKSGIRANIKVYSSNYIANPCITGIFNPKIYIPQEVLAISDRQQLKHILMHEYAHYKRWDNLSNIFILAVNVVHWFNPILWYAMHQLKQDVEVSCDVYALEMLGFDEVIPYGMTLINHCRQRPKRGIQLNLLNYYETENQVKRRIVMIKNFKKGTYKVTVAALILCLSLGAITLTNATAPKVNTDSASNNSMDAKFRLAGGLLTEGKTYFNVNLEQATKYADFDFKIPDYIPNGARFWMIEGDDKINKVYFNKNVDLEGDLKDKVKECYYEVWTCKTNPLQAIKNVKDGYTHTYQEKAAEISGVKGTMLTDFSKDDANVNWMTKYFIWSENNVWYSIVNHNISFTSDYIISNEELEQIVKSMKFPEQIKNADYSWSKDKGFEIYDEEDLKKVESVYGFKTKFPLSLPGGLVPDSARIKQYEDGEYVLVTRYSLKKEPKEKEKNLEFLMIMLIQGKYSFDYDQVKEKNSAFMKINGIDIYKIGDNYIWKQNNLYYSADIDKEIEEKDRENIIKTFINAPLK